MEIGVRHSTSGVPSPTRPTRRCLQCHTDALAMRRRHVSAPGWGESVVTEYYDCESCEAQVLIFAGHLSMEATLVVEPLNTHQDGPRGLSRGLPHRVRIEPHLSLVSFQALS